MTNSKKWQIAIALVLTCNLSLRPAEEPNDPNNSQIKIEISDQEMRWAHTSAIRPTHVAEVFIRRSSSGLSVRQETLLETSAAAAMTPKQREFMEASTVTVAESPGSGVANHHRIFLYAVSEADAKKMVEAFIEIVSERPNRIRLEYAAKLRKYQEEMAKAKGLLPGKEALLPSVKAEYDKSKESAHAFSADTEAAEHARQTMLEMSKMLDTLDVELAGIREKLNVINDYWSKRGEMSEAARGKLQEMEIEQMVELKGAEARRKAAVAIRKREKDFFDLFDQWTSLDSEVKGLRSTIDNRQEHIAEYEAILANPKPDMLPPQIYQNKVTIYPVRTD
jgi:hypothetical protein